MLGLFWFMPLEVGRCEFSRSEKGWFQWKIVSPQRVGGIEKGISTEIPGLFLCVEENVKTAGAVLDVCFF